MKIKELSFNCNVFLTISSIIIFLYVFFYTPTLTFESKKKLMNL